MTRYTVVWATDVQNDFLDQWIAADSSSRRRLTALASKIDQELAVAPDMKGSPHPADPSWHVWELSTEMAARVVFKVYKEDRLVRVLRISVSD